MKVTRKQALLALDMLRFPGRLTGNVQDRGGPEHVLKELYRSKNSWNLGGWSPKGPAWDLGFEGLVQRVLQIEKRLRHNSVWIFSPNHENPLSRLKRPPLLLYGFGNPELLTSEVTRVAVVGSRSPSPKGRKRTRQWVESWTNHGVQIVSGGAHGIDSEAHSTALRAGGATLAFLGRQLDRNLRMPNLHWARDSEPSRICLVTEYSPWRPSQKGTFVARNRLVAGMSRRVVVMEGHASSGAIHTLKYAKQNNIPGYVVLGEPENPLAGAGCRAICENLAQPALSPSQILEFTEKKNTIMHLPLDSLGQLKIKPPRANQFVTITDQNQRKVFSLISARASGLSFEELLHETQLALPVLQGALTEMELEGWLAQKGALYYPKG